MTAIRIPFAAAGLALLLGSPLAFAQDKPEGPVDSATPEAQEDCEALREAMERRDDDNVLDPRDEEELRERGC